MLLLLIGLVVGAVALSLYQVKSLYYLRQDALTEQNQNLKAALSSLAREARMTGNVHKLTGWGVKRIQLYLPDDQGGGRWFSYPGASEAGLLPVYGLDGGPDGPDELTLLSAALESAQPVGRLMAPYTPGRVGEQSLRFQQPMRDKAVKTGQMLLLCDGQAALIIQAGHFADEKRLEAIAPQPGRDAETSSPTRLRIVPNQARRLIIGKRFRPAESLPGTQDAFPAGTSVYNLGELTLTRYYIDTSRNMLMAREYTGNPGEADYGRSDPIIVADGIEDLQLRYIADDGTPLAPGGGTNQPDDLALDEYPVRVINLALVSKSTYREKNQERTGIPAIFNRRARAGDDYQRLILSESVFLR